MDSIDSDVFVQSCTEVYILLKWEGCWVPVGPGGRFQMFDTHQGAWEWGRKNYPNTKARHFSITMLVLPASPNEDL